MDAKLEAYSLYREYHEAVRAGVVGRVRPRLSALAESVPVGRVLPARAGPGAKGKAKGEMGRSSLLGILGDW
jgi:hypothetical protein